MGEFLQWIGMIGAVIVFIIGIGLTNSEIKNDEGKKRQEKLIIGIGLSAIAAIVAWFVIQLITFWVIVALVIVVAILVNQ